LKKKRKGEALIGVFKKEGIVAIGGINRDPYSNDPLIGRLRRFYAAEAFRRSAVGTVLLNLLILKAKSYYKVLVLHTVTLIADKFYYSFGFQRQSTYPNSTHYLKL